MTGLTYAEPYGAGHVAPTAPAAVPAAAYAGFWARVAAALLDYFILYPLGFAIGFLVGIIGAAAGSTGDGVLVVAFIAALLAGRLFKAGFMARSGPRNGQSLGKQVAAVRVIHPQGQITVGLAIGREGLKLLLTVVTLGLTHLWPLWDERRQALHDKLLGTYVVADAGNAASPNAWGHLPSGYRAAASPAYAAATPAIAADGWYADPWGVAGFRYWAGGQWTGMVA